MTQYVYHPDRHTKPLKRVGQRGEGKFEPISWEEAYNTCEARLKDIRDQFGAESVIFVQGTGRDVGGSISFLCYNFGSLNWVQLGLSGQACYTPRLGYVEDLEPRSNAEIGPKNFFKMACNKEAKLMRYAALLRGVNVGKSVKVPMARLRSLIEDLGFQDMVTYLNSGNVIFNSELPMKRPLPI